MNMEQNDYKVSRCPHGWVANCVLCAAAVEREKCLALRDPLRDWLGDPDEAIRACISEIDRLILENEALKTDAERYRYLRNRIPHDVLNTRGDAAGCWIDCEVEHMLTLLTGADADEQIDVAIRARMSENGGTS